MKQIPEMIFSEKYYQSFFIIINYSYISLTTYTHTDTYVQYIKKECIIEIINTRSNELTKTKIWLKIDCFSLLYPLFLTLTIPLSYLTKYNNINKKDTDKYFKYMNKNIFD